jgi:hypothetical protein
MPLEKRIKLINFLEEIFIKEAIEDFEKNNKRPVVNEEKIQIGNSWLNYTSNFTRMWLNYLTDENLEKILSNKLNSQNNNNGINQLTGKI